MNVWYYQGTEFNPTNAELLIKHYVGFVYLITDETTNRKYVGKKSFFSFRAGGKRESDWRTYIGSSTQLTRDIIEHGWKNFRRVILSIHTHPQDVDYYEVRELFLRDVLHSKLANGLSEYYNDVIPSIHFKRKS